MPDSELRLYTHDEVAALHKRIAELEMQAVRMECYDDNITESRVFRIEFNKLLNPEEAMSIFMRNIERIFSKPFGNSGQFK